MKLNIPNANRLTDRLFYQTTGQIFVSALFGIALAFTFQKVCKDRKCLLIKAPNLNEMTTKVHEFDGQCYRYTTSNVKCPADGAAASAVIQD